MIASVMMAFFSLLTLNNIVFRHAHRLANGQIITHAHPFWPSKNKHPYQPNHHTNGQLVLLDALAYAVFLPDTPLIPFLPGPVIEFTSPSLSFQQAWPVSAPIRALPQRGPPALA